MSSPPLDSNTTLPILAPCEHIAGNDRFIRKALELQKQHLTADGRSLLDVTMDLEDGAPVGGESSLRKTVIDLLLSSGNDLLQAGVRVHSPTSEHFRDDIVEIVRDAGERVAYLTIPKVSGVAEVQHCTALVDETLHSIGSSRRIPLHILIETPAVLSCIEQIAALPAVETLDFGLMDFISHLGGAIPSECMRSPGQFDHRILAHVKTQLCLAAVSHGKIASHNVTVDFRDPLQALADARRARSEFGFMRMWSIHPSQIEPIIAGILPSGDEVTAAKEIIDKAERAGWGPIEHNGRLHDRASYRYYWQLLQRA
jgi:citrate lyase subunit beta/citryl-CoA lyase